MRFPIDGHINDMDAEKLKHLDYIQSAISRMADCSFKIKSLVITIVSAIVGICIKTGDMNILLVAIVPIVLFWILDSYYLQQERMFREIYNILIGISNNRKLEIRPFEMPIAKIRGTRYSFLVVMFSKTECLLYLGVLLLILLVFCYIRCKHC